MMTPDRLFRIRLKFRLKEQWKAWNSALDWTVWLYILVPALLVGGGFYRDFWLDMPEWAEMVPWRTGLAIALLLPMIMGRVRVFVEEADRLFMLQKKEWLLGLKRRGMLYTACVQAALLLFPFAVLLPFLVRAEGMGGLEIVQMYAHTWLASLTWSIVSQWVDLPVRGWRKWLLEGCCLIAWAAAYLVPVLLLGSGQGAAVMVPAFAVMATAAAASAYGSLRSGIRFEAEVKQDRDVRNRSTEFLLSQTGNVRPLSKRKRPLLLRRSQRLFKGTDAAAVLAEMRIKAFVRSSVVRIWIGYTSVCTTAIVAAPPSASVVLIPAFTYIGASWLRAQWEQWIAEEYIAHFEWSAEASAQAAVLSRFWLLLPPLLVWSAVAGAQAFGLWAVVPALPVCAVAWALMNGRLRFGGPRQAAFKK